MSKQHIALVALSPLLLAGLLIYGGGRMIYGAMSKYGIQQDPVRTTREFVGYINDLDESWLGVGLIFAGALSILVTSIFVGQHPAKTMSWRIRQRDCWNPPNKRSRRTVRCATRH